MKARGDLVEEQGLGFRVQDRKGGRVSTPELWGRGATSLRSSLPSSSRNSSTPKMPAPAHTRRPPSQVAWILESSPPTNYTTRSPQHRWEEQAGCRGLRSVNPGEVPAIPCVF